MNSIYFQTVYPTSTDNVDVNQDSPNTIDVNQTSTDVAIVDQNTIDTDINQGSTDNSEVVPVSTKRTITILDEPKDLKFPDTPKECPSYIAVCSGVLKTANDMLKHLNKYDENYNAIIMLSWKYAVLRLKAQYYLGEYFSRIEGAQGTNPNKANTPNTAKPTKEQILKDEFGVSVKEAWLHEQLYQHKDLFKRTIKRALTDNDLPTLRLANKIYNEDKEEAKKKQQNQEKHEKNQEKLKEKAIKDALKFQKLHRTEATSLDDDTFNVIYADPVSVNIPMNTLKGIDIPANKNSILLLWTDTNNLLDALGVIKNWGFVYKDMCIWNHINASQKGTYTRSQHSILLFATKGEGLKPDDNSLEPSVLSLHPSQIDIVKAYYYDMLETMFPDAAYLDLCDTTAYNSKWKTLSEISTQQSNSIKGE